VVIDRKAGDELQGLSGLLANYGQVRRIGRQAFERVGNRRQLVDLLTGKRGRDTE
jgi:hypothetical protein